MTEYLKNNLKSSSKDILEEIALRGFKEKLMEILEKEIDEYLGRKKYERLPGENKIYRNGYSKQRRIR